MSKQTYQYLMEDNDFLTSWAASDEPENILNSLANSYPNLTLNDIHTANEYLESELREYFLKQRTKE